MNASQDAQLEALLRDPACPWAEFWRGRGNRAIVVADLLRFARACLGDRPGLERRLDAYVESIGGHRRRLIDPWSVPRWAFGALVGRRHPSPDAYEVPADLDRLPELAERATANATREATIRFGAPVSVPEIAAVDAFVKKHARSGILRYLDCTEKMLRSFSRHEISVSQLPSKTQLRLRESIVLTEKLAQRKLELWPRKIATVLYALHLERKGAPGSTGALETDV